jgi:hypothetical protein
MMVPGFILHDNCDGEPCPAVLYCYKRSMTFAFLVFLCASVSIRGAHWVQILEYSSSPIMAITVPILVDSADHNSSVMWLLLHITLLTWRMWVTTPYHSRPVSLITSHCFNCTSLSAILVSECGVAICWAKYLWRNMIENVQGILCCCHCSYNKEWKEL